MLSNKFGHRFFIVLAYAMKTENQGRGTPHWHIAAWVVCFGLLSRLAGRSKKYISAFVKFLELLLRCEIDVQVGNGRLNYINGSWRVCAEGCHRAMACSVSLTLQKQPLHTRGCHPYGTIAGVRPLILPCPPVSTATNAHG